MTTAPLDAPTGGPDQGDPAPTMRRKRSARLTFASTVLLLEAFVVLFATLMAFGLRAAPPGVIWACGGTLAVVLLLLSGMLKRPGGYLAGSVVQVLILAGGVVLLGSAAQAAAFVALSTLAVGVVFVALWILGLRLGGRIDRERAEWDAAHPAG
ncbi:DUF4233 domain-containing protein [Pengzhenrongella sp.]|jgi:hypothetical protein|uniref:DUF4233 domain-containing protein n=1 Tax=Pengzhenrongella sp. TaxID=2888820 RepID=UPI002F9550E5